MSIIKLNTLGYNTYVGTVGEIIRISKRVSIKGLYSINSLSRGDIVVLENFEDNGGWTVVYNALAFHKVLDATNGSYAVNAAEDGTCLINLIHRKKNHYGETFYTKWLKEGHGSDATYDCWYERKKALLNM